MQVLMIEDNEDDFLLFSRYFVQIDTIKLTWRTSLALGVDYITSHLVDVVLLDMDLPDGHGLTIFDQTQARFPTLPIIILSGRDDDELALEAVRRGAQDYLTKDQVNGEILRRSLRYAVERKRVENILASERDLLRTLIDNTPDYIYVKDTQSRFVMANNAVLDAFGLTKVEQIIGKTDFDFLPTDIAQSFYDDEQQVMVSGQAFVNKEEASVDRQMWFLVTKTPLRNEHGHITGLLGISRNISERKQAEEKLNQERDLLRALIDSSPDYIFIKDVEGRFVVTNIAHAQAVDATPDEMVGKTAFEVFPPDLAAQFHADDEQIIQSGTPLVNLERTTLGKHGEIKTVLTTKIPLQTKEGHITGLVGISRDITERKQLEMQTHQLMAERERSTILQRFIGDMSHDFRTPLTVLNNSFYLIQKTTDPQKRQAYTDRIEQQLLRMDKLLDELLQMAQLDRQETSLQFDLMEIDALLNRLILEYEPIAAAEQITIQHVHDTASCFARIDAVEFARALLNLLENAVTYTPEGGNITVRTSTHKDYVIISVQDTGMGITTDDLPHIFERFYRADQARSTATGRHGLGLSIAKSIIETHNGSIQVESQLGQGSTFIIQLPISS